MSTTNHFIIGQPEPGIVETACGDTVPLFPIPPDDAPKCKDCLFLLTMDPSLDPGDEEEGVIIVAIVEVGPFPTDPAA